VTLLRQPGVKWADVTADLLDSGSAVEVLSRQFGVGDTLFHDQVTLDHALTEAASLIDAWVANGIGVHSLFDAATRPGCGTSTRRRRCSSAGERWLTTVGPSLWWAPVDRPSAGLSWPAGSPAHWPGMASPSSQASRRASTQRRTLRLLRRAGGRTVAVVGTGISRYYPAENRGLQQRIAAEGLVISQFWPDAAPTKFSFPMRNAVMSGYSAATVVVEAEYRSGARMQARLALEHGRPVVLANELLVHDWARNYATKPGVHVVHDPDELVTVVNEIVRQIPESLDELVS
jgi:DNA processing protein